MKIMIISDLAPPVVTGGIENYITNLGKGLVKKGHEVHWLTSKLPGTKSEETLEGIQIHRVTIPFSRNYFFPGRHLFSITSLIKGMKLAREMDVIHVNTLIPGFLSWAVAKYSGKPTILFCHEFYGDLWKSVGRNFFEKYFYPLFEKMMCKFPYDFFVCPSEYSKKTLIKCGVDENKIKIIPHGTNYQKPQITKDFRSDYNLKNELLIGYLGRLNIKNTGQGKNLLGLLQAIKHVVNEIPTAKLVLGGSGYRDLKKYIKNLGIENNIIYLGKIPSNAIKSFFKMCNVVVCPALSDGFCFLLAEASASGIPVIGTSRGAHLERIKNNINGILTEPEPKSMSESIIEVLKNKKLAVKLGKNGKKMTKKLTWEKSVEDHIKLYKKIIS